MGHLHKLDKYEKTNLPYICQTEKIYPCAKQINDLYHQNIFPAQGI